MSLQHLALAQQLGRAINPPIGINGPWQWGTIQTIGTGAAAGTCSVFLDSNAGVPTPGIPYLTSYSPTVGDAVFIGRMGGAARTARVIFGKIGSNAAGRMYAGSQTVISSDVVTQVTSLVQDFAQGGVTCASNAITVPSQGVYAVSASIGWQNSGGNVPAGDYVAFVFVNGSEVRRGRVSTAQADEPEVPISDSVFLHAGDVLTLYGDQNSGANQATNPGTNFTWLSATLIP